MSGVGDIEICCEDEAWPLSTIVVGRSEVAERTSQDRRLDVFAMVAMRGTRDAAQSRGDSVDVRVD